MSEAKKNSAASNDKRTTVLQFLINSVFVICFSLILSILVEWIGMTYFWKEEGSKHSLNMLSTEINYINEDFSHRNIFGYRPIDFISFSHGYFYGTEDNAGIAQGMINWLNSPDSPDDFFLESFIKDSGNGVKEYLLAAVFIFLVFIIRLSILVLSLPLFILVAVVGLIDGLAIRDKRRWSNGRESGFRYHYAKSFVLPSFFIAWILYLSIPVSIHPNFIILPLGVLMGLVIRETLSWFKKYL